MTLEKEIPHKENPHSITLSEKNLLNLHINGHIVELWDEDIDYFLVSQEMIDRLVGIIKLTRKGLI